MRGPGPGRIRRASARIIAMAVTLSIELTDEQFGAIQRMSAQAGRSPSEVAAEALLKAIDADSWFRAEVEQAVREADAGDFASQEEVDAVVAKWTAT